eukprot:349688-Chlamydomonas_euryale.AAC.8
MPPTRALRQARSGGCRDGGAGSDDALRSQAGGWACRSVRCNWSAAFGPPQPGCCGRTKGSQAAAAGPKAVGDGLRA